MIDPILKRALDTWGEQAQMMMVVEEMSELTKEILKNVCRHKNNLAEIVEETADVEIMLPRLILQPLTQRLKKSTVQSNSLRRLLPMATLLFRLQSPLQAKLLTPLSKLLRKSSRKLSTRRLTLLPLLQR